MSYSLYVDSDNSVTFEVEYDYKDPEQRFSSDHITPSGRMYNYVWGTKKQYSFSVTYINSSDRFTINKWWANNTDLNFLPNSSFLAKSVRIMNTSEPIDSRIKPYNDQFAGKIILGEY